MKSDNSDLVAQTNSVIAELAAVNNSFSFSLAARGLAQIRDDLTASQRPTLELHLDGAPVTRHEVRADIFARLISSLQESITSIAQAIAGKITTRSSIPGPLRDITALRLATTFPGSFGAVLRGPDSEVQLEIPGLEEPSDLLSLSVNKVLDIIDLANNGNLEDSSIIDAVLPLGARSFKHLSDLSRVVSETGLSAEISWVSRQGADERREAFSKPIASRLGDVLARNQVTEEQLTIEGRLGTVSDIRNRIELQTSTGDVITAAVIEELVSQLGRYYANNVRASFEVTTARSIVSGLERRSYRLVGLEMIGSQVSRDGVAHFGDS